MSGCEVAGEHGSPLRLGSLPSMCGTMWASSPTNECKLFEDGTPETASPTVGGKSMPFVGGASPSPTGTPFANHPAPSGHPSAEGNWGVFASLAALSMVRRILESSSMRSFLLWRRPAVSIRTTSILREIADFMLSKTTADGSAPCSALTMGTLARSAQISSCSVAAARKVSAAERRTDLPCFWK